MKKIFFITLIVFSASIISAQNIFPLPSGNTGIGTTTPAYNLDVSSAANTTVQIGSTTVTTGYSNLIFKGSLNKWTISKSPSGSGPSSTANLAFNYNNGVYGGDFPLMQVYYSGSGGGVVIGVNANTNIIGGCALAVEGKIGARELVISSLTPFPDYVFEPNYKLRSLSEIEKYIKQYNHLPEMPSAEDVKKNGLQVGAMTTLLVQKIEELTLQMIEMNKQIEILQKEKDEFKAKK